MSRLATVLESDAGAAEVTNGPWRAVIWHDHGANREAWHYAVHQPQGTDEDLPFSGEHAANSLAEAMADLARYPYFLTDEMPWQPSRLPHQSP